MDEHEKACQTYVKLADLLRQANFDVEAEMAEEEGRKIKLKMME